MREPEPGPLVTASGLREGFAQARGDIGRFNLALFGVTGAGKSTLINAVFGAELAETGIGEPVTQDSRLYRHGTSQLGIFDTKGLEVGSDNTEILRDLRRFVDDNRLGDIADQIHVIWYCVRAGDSRLQPAEEEFIASVADLGIRVIIVMTQTPRPGGTIHTDARELAAFIESRNLPISRGVVFVNAQEDAFAGNDAFGLQDLLDVTSQVAPDGVRNALAAAQRVHRAQKRTRAHALIVEAEQRLRGRVFLTDVAQTWARMFAGIASIYDVPEEQAVAVFDEARTLARLRRLLATGEGLLYVGTLIPVGGLTGLIARATVPTGAKLANKWLGRAKQAKEQGVPVAWLDEDAGDLTRAEKQKIGTGFAAGSVTRGIGEAWVTACDRFWSEAFPEPLVIDDSNRNALAEAFAEDLSARLPVLLQRYEERLKRKAEAKQASS